jgi:HSP20 family protein
MAIVRYPRNRTRRVDPWAELDWFANRMNRMFGDTAGGDLSYGSGWVPSVNVEERDEEILLTAELPGLNDEDIDLELENNVLTISGEKEERREEGEKGGRFHLVERSFGSFRRSFTHPRTVEADSIEAHFDNGLLTVRMPKAAEAKSRKIGVAKKA